MARQGSPLLGLQDITERIYVAGRYSLVCYTNTQDSLGPNTLLADLTQPTEANGYLPLPMNGTFTHNLGVLSYQHQPGSNRDEQGNPCWFPSGTWSATVTGVAMISNDSGRVVHFLDIRDGAGTPTTWIAAAGKRFPVDFTTLSGS